MFTFLKKHNEINVMRHKSFVFIKHGELFYSSDLTLSSANAENREGEAGTKEVENCEFALLLAFTNRTVSILLRITGESIESKVDVRIRSRYLTCEKSQKEIIDGTVDISSQRR